MINKIDSKIGHHFDHYFNEVSKKCSKKDIQEIYTIDEFYDKVKGLRAVHQSVATSYKNSQLKPGHRQRFYLTIFCLLFAIVILLNISPAFSTPVFFDIGVFAAMAIMLHLLFNDAFNLELDDDTAREVADNSQLPVPATWVENILKDGRLTGEQRETLISMMDNGKISYINAILFCEQFLKSEYAA